MNKLIAFLAVFALVGSLFPMDAAFAGPKSDDGTQEKSNNRDNENSNRDHDKVKDGQDDDCDGVDEDCDGADKEKKAKKGVLICHYTSRIVLVDGTEMVWGKVLRVSERAVEAHLAHGDELAGEDAEAGDDCWAIVEDEAPADES